MYTQYTTGKADSNPSPAGSERVTLQAPSDFPVIMMLGNADGRQIEAEVTGRSQTHIQFNRISDGVSFDYPISSLDAKTRSDVEALEISRRR